MQSLGREQSIVLSFGFWQRQFAGKPDIINQTVRLNGQPYTIIGVMPATVNFPGHQQLLGACRLRRAELRGSERRSARPARRALPARCRTPQGRDVGRTGERRTDDDLRSAGEAVSGRLVELHRDREAAAGTARRIGAHAVAGAAWRGRLRAADRRRERGEPVDGSRHRARARAGDPRRDRRRSFDADAPAAHRERRDRAGWRRARRAARVLGRRPDSRARSWRSAARRSGERRRLGARLRADAVDRDRRAVRRRSRLAGIASRAAEHAQGQHARRDGRRPAPSRARRPGARGSLDLAGPAGWRGAAVPQPDDAHRHADGLHDVADADDERRADGGELSIAGSIRGLLGSRHRARRAPFPAWRRSR